MAENDLLNMGAPGYTVAATLQNILAQKRQESHDQLMESMAQRNQDLNARNVESEISSRNQAANSQEEIRTANAEQRRAQAAKLLEDSNNNKLTQDYLKNYKTTNPDAYKALPKEDQAGLDFASGLPANHPLVQEMVKRIMTPAKPATRTGGYLWTEDQKGNPYNTGQWMEGVQGDQFHAPIREPQAPASALTPHYQTFDVQDDPTDPQSDTHKETHMMVGDQRPDFTDNSKTRISGLRVQDNKQGRPFVINPSIDAKLKKARDDFEKTRSSHSLLHPFSGNPAGDPTLRAAMTAQAMAAITGSGLSPDGTSAVTDLLNDPEADNIKSSEIDLSARTPKDQAILKRLLPVIRSR